MAKFRTDIESLLLEEMMEEDANYLLLGDGDDDVMDDIISNANSDIFSTSSEDTMVDDIDINDDDSSDLF